jgi:hypothetical protein
MEKEFSPLHAIFQHQKTFMDAQFPGNVKMFSSFIGGLKNFDIQDIQFE